jgi:hypothetical protein
VAGTKDLEAQADILAQMQEAMGGLSDSMGTLNDGANSFTDAMSSIVDMLPGIGEGSQNMSELAANAGDATEETTNMTSAMEKLVGKQKESAAAVGDGTKKLKKYVAAGAGLAIIGSIFTNMAGMIKSVGSLLSGIVTTSTNMIKSIWSAYTATWDALGAMSKEMYKEGLKIAKAYEEVRTTFGDLSTGSGAAVVGMFNDIRSSGDFANQTGMSLFHTFGDMAAQIKIFNAIAKEGGEVFRRSAENWKNAGFEALMMNKAFGVGGKAMALMGEDAVRAGGSAKEATEAYAKMAVGLKKGFGVELKSLGKNFTALKEDVKAFGHMSQKELVATAGYASALGVEVKSLKGMFDAFSNFEDAAAGAAKLGEAFGMNLDTMALMNAESPAEQMDQMRNAFMETGKSVDDLSRHQRAYLAETMKVDPNDLTAMFNPDNADISYDDMIAAADDAEKELSPAEAMKEAAKEITKAFEQLTVQSNTFFGHFKEGFLSGLKMTKPFRQFFQVLHKSMREVYQVGRDLAQQLFGKGGVFSDDAMGFVGKWKSYLSEIVKWFKKLSGFIVGFAKDIKGGGDPSAAIQTFLDNIFASVSDFFSSDAVVEWNKMLAGFMKTAAQMFEKLAVGLIHWVADKIKNIAISWSDDTGVMSAWGEAFMALWESLKVVATELWKILGPPLLEGMEKLWEWLKPHLMTALKYMFIFAITKALVSAAAVALAGAVLKGILGGMMGAVGKATAALGPAAPSVGPVQSMMDTAQSLGSTVIAWPLAIFNAGMLTLFILGGFLLTLGAFVLLYKVISTMKPAMALTTAAVLVALAVAFYAMSKAVAALSKILPPQLIAAAAGAGLVALAMLGMGLIAVAMIEMIRMSSPMPKIGDIGMFFGVMGVTLIAGALALYLATIAAKFAKPQTLLGLGLLGIAMLGLGKVAQTIAEMFGSINPSVLKQVGPIMNAMAILMMVVMLALPVAGLLGVMLMAWPFGTAGIAIIAAGFAVLGSLAVHMVNGLMPAVEKIGQIKVKDPASVEQITKAIAAIIIAMSSFMAQVANTMNAAKPAKGSGDTMAGNLKAMEGTIGAVLNPMMKIINVLVDLVANAQIKPENLKALQVIGDIMGSLADLSSSITPSPEHLKMIKKSANWWNGKKNTKILDAMNSAMDKQRDFIISLMITAGVVIVAMLKAASQIKGPGAAQALEATAKILQIVVDIVSEMKPTKEQMKAARAAARGGAGGKAMRMISNQMNQMAGVIAPIIRALGDATVIIMKAIAPTIALIGQMKVDPKALEAVAKIMAAVMSGVVGLASGLGPAMTAMQKSAKASSSGGGFSLWSGRKGTDEAGVMSGLMANMGTMVKSMASGMECMIGAIKNLIILILQQAKGIKNPKAMAARMEVVVMAVEVVGAMMKPLQLVMELMSKNMGKKSSYWGYSSMIRMLFGSKGKDGLMIRIMKEAGYGIRILMWSVIKSTKGIKDPKKMKARMELISMGMDIVGKMIKFLSPVMDMLMTGWKDGNAKWQSTIRMLFGTNNKGGLLTDIIKEAGYGMRILMDNVKSATRGIKNPKAMMARMELISLGMDITGKMVKSVGAAVDMMDKLSGGKNDPAKQKAMIRLLFGTNRTGGLMTDIIKEAGYGMRIMMQQVQMATKGIKNPKALMSRMKLVAFAMEVTGTMIDNLSKTINMIKSVAGDETSAYAIKKYVRVLFGNDRKGGVMTDIIKESAYGMRLLMAGVMEATKDIKSPSATMKRIKVVVAGFDAMGAMTTAIMTMKGTGDMTSAKADVKGLTDIFADDAVFTPLKTSIHNITTFTMARSGSKALELIKSAIPLLNEGISPLFMALRTFSNTPGNQWDVLGMNDNILGTTSGVGLQQLMATVGNLQLPETLNPAPYFIFKNFIETMIIPLFETIGEAAGGAWFKPKTNEAMGRLVRLVEGDGTWSGLKELIRSVSSIGKLSGIKKAAGVIQNLGIMMASISSTMFRVIKYAPPPGMIEFMTARITETFNSMAGGLKFNVKPEQLDSSVEVLGQFADRFISIAKSLDRVRYALFRVVKFADTKVTPDVVVQKAAAKIDELSKAFATLDELVVDSTMAKVAAGLQGVGELKVNHKGLAINVKINVIVDSKQLAASLNPDDGAYFIINEDREVPVSAAEFLG